MKRAIIMFFEFKITGNDDTIKECCIRYERNVRRRLDNITEIQNRMSINDLIAKDGDSGTLIERLLFGKVKEEHSTSKVWIEQTRDNKKNSYSSSIDFSYCARNPEDLVEYFMNNFSIHIERDEIIEHEGTYYVKAEIKTGIEKDDTRAGLSKKRSRLEMSGIHLNRFTILIMGLRFKGSIQFYIAHKNRMLNTKLTGLGRKKNVLTSGAHSLNGAHRIEIPSTTAQTSDLDKFFSDQFAKFSLHFCTMNTTEFVTFTNTGD